MELVDGVHIHVMNSHKFKSNVIKIRFTSTLSRYSVSARAIVAAILETANQSYPRLKDLQRHLASLYGAELSTSVHIVGDLHLVDIDLIFVKDRFLSKKQFLIEGIFDLISEVLFNPLIEDEAFTHSLFQTERENLIELSERERENDFSQARNESFKAFYRGHPDLSLANYGNKELLESETARSTYKEFQRMMREDRIDFLFFGEFPEKMILDRIRSWDLQPRKELKSLTHFQAESSVVQEVFQKAMGQQSVLDLAYYTPVFRDEKTYPALVLLNALLGQFPHSFLFRKIREEEGLAYTVGSQLHVFSHLFRIYVGFEAPQRNVIFKQIRQEMNRIRRGFISEEHLSMSKKMLLNLIVQVEDSPMAMVERTYQTAMFGSAYSVDGSFQKAIEAVTYKDIQMVARNLQLQSMIFLEGSSE
ncbi:insulinase family protein [Streptococcus danieliae]|uniref:Insulinase family protein n=1 Tax=Streptococcus danieliae TaxID=747656 RepID=A0A7Z0LC81_9STRE|nr:insulinase family protein [Streptococcus danieliae]MBF0716754.1 insulinase family protein [Streptococcus danieliae]NYS48684.1 insulinase family protein [Streptococcus danieliae]